MSPGEGRLWLVPVTEGQNCSCSCHSRPCCTCLSPSVRASWLGGVPPHPLGTEVLPCELQAVPVLPSGWADSCVDGHPG